jgi:hypothetical protein
MDSAKNNQLPPPPAIYSDPLEIKLRKFFFMPLKKFFPESKIVKAHNLFIAANAFEENAAVIGAVNYMAKDFKGLSDFYKDSAEVIKECGEFLDEIKKIAQGCIDNLEREYGQSLSAIKRKLLTRIALDAEMTALEGLVINGELPDNAAERIKSEIEEDFASKKKD